MNESIQVQNEVIELKPARMEGKLHRGLFSVWHNGANTQIVVSQDEPGGSIWCSYVRKRFADLLELAVEMLGVNPESKREGTKEAECGVWTPEAVAELLNSNQAAVNRAVVALFNQQDEKQKRGFSSGKIRGRGFSRYDRPKGNRLAKRILSRQPLNPREQSDAAALAFKYRRQLASIANEKGN